MPNELAPAKAKALPSLAEAARRGVVTAIRRTLGPGAEDRYDLTAINREIDRVMAELAGPAPTPLETILAERAAICWAFAHWADFHAESFTGTVALADYHQRQRDRAHRRFLAACKALAQVRKLGIQVQINVAHQQVVTGP